MILFMSNTKNPWYFPNRPYRRYFYKGIKSFISGTILLRKCNIVFSFLNKVATLQLYPLYHTIYRGIHNQIYKFFICICINHYDTIVLDTLIWCQNDIKNNCSQHYMQTNKWKIVLEILFRKNFGNFLNVLFTNI